jgi:CheY-like chemotaxis protein
MTKVLLVDDDPVVLKIYQERLSHQGLQVSTAADGLAAISSLRAGKPDVVVLDLMMPKLSGVDVLKFIRSEADLKEMPVIVLSNSYMNDLSQEAATIGVQKALLKVRCSPSLLIKAINDVLSGQAGEEDASELLAAPDQPPPAPATPVPPPTEAAPKGTPAPAAARAELETVTAEFQAKARRGFLQGGAATCNALRTLCQAFVAAPSEAERDLRLQDFYRKVHFVAATAGLAGCPHLAQMSTVFEALLFELINRPLSISPSVMRTVAATVDFLTHLFDCARDSDSEVPLSAEALGVDDDAVANRMVVAALLCAHLKARSTDDPLEGLQWMKEMHFDLVLLDIEMPGMDGFELCRRLRLLQGYQKTPVIFITSHTDFESRARSVLSGGGDIIAKPIFPIELAVKAVSHLLKSKLAEQAPKA